MMNTTLELGCEEVERLLPLFLDDELEGDDNNLIEGHLGECGECRLLLEREGRLRFALRQASETISAPIRLRRRLDDAIDEDRQRSHKMYRAWPAAAAAAVLLAFVWKGAFSGHTDYLREAALRHSYDLPMDVVAGDMGSVGRYLSGKLPFAVKLPNRLEEAAQSLGGRVTQLGERQTAYVRMDMPRGRVSVFVYESQPGEAIYEGAPSYRVAGQDVFLKRVRGYTTARWFRDGLVYSVVTDLAETELPEVVRRISY